MSNQRKRSSGRTSGSRTKTSNAKTGSKKPKRREIGGAVCLLLAVIAFVSFFGADSIFINWIRFLARGLIGGGYYVLPLSLLVSAWILLLHDGRPVRLRVVCAFLVSVSIGMLVHLFGSAKQEWSFAMFGQLFNDGMEGSGGGMISGFLAQVFEATLGKVISIILLIIATLFELLTSFNMTVSGIVSAIRQRPRLDYDEPKKQHRDPAKVIVDHVAQKQIDRAQRRIRPVDIDLPVDDPLGSDEPAAVASAAAVAAETGKRGKRPISPDELLLQQEKGPQTAPESDALSKEEAAEKTETQS